MLYLLVRLGNDAYAIEAKTILRVVPFARLKSLPSAAAGIAGVLNYHGRPVPVIDLTRLLTGVPSRERLATRIVLAHVNLPPAGDRTLGLLVDEAQAVARLDPTTFRSAGVRPDGAPWLGPVVDHERQLVQRIDVGKLLPPEILVALIQDGEAALSA